MYNKISQVALIAFLFTSCANTTGKLANPVLPKEVSETEITTASGLRYRILKAGKGTSVTPKEKVLFNETVSYMNGKQLYSTRNTGMPIITYLGNGQLIDGLEEGLMGMKVGETRQLIIPPTLHQLNEYPSFISPDSTLIYVIELKAFGVHKWYKETHSGSQPEQAGC